MSTTTAPPSTTEGASPEALQAEVNRLKLELNALQVEDRSEQIFIGDYLLARLEQLGVTSMF
ncbi:hypothetical protein PQX77_006553, partial [Marasmius sp. AFHP31]